MLSSEQIASLWPPGLKEGSTELRNVEFSGGIFHTRLLFDGKEYWLTDDKEPPLWTAEKPFRLERDVPGAKETFEVRFLPDQFGQFEYTAHFVTEDDERKVHMMGNFDRIPKGSTRLPYVGMILLEVIDHTHSSSKEAREAAIARRKAVVEQIIGYGMAAGTLAFIGFITWLILRTGR